MLFLRSFCKLTSKISIMARLFALLCLILIFQGPLISQGLIFDYDSYENRETIPKTRADIIPYKFSLEKYTPYVLQQRGGTCVANSLAVVRTMIFAKNNRIESKKEISLNLFSPHWVYYRNRLSNDYFCEKGLNIEKAITDILNNGIPKALNVEYPDYYPFTKQPLCNFYPPSYEENVLAASLYKIDNAYKLDDLESIKLSISNGMPVIIGMLVPKSFTELVDSNLWRSKDSDSLEDSYAHAMVIVAYNDLKAGGAVKVMNSWGTGWGENGFAWITYKDLLKYTMGAYGFSSSQDFFGASTSIDTSELNADRKLEPINLEKNDQYKNLFSDN